MTKQMTLQDIREEFDKAIMVIVVLRSMNGHKEWDEHIAGYKQALQALDYYIERMPDGLCEAVDRIEINLIKYGPFTGGFQSDYDMKNVKEAAKLLNDMKPRKGE